MPSDIMHGKDSSDEGINKDVPLKSSNFKKFSSVFRTKLSIRRDFSDNLGELGRAKENAYFIKLEQEQLKLLRRRLRKKERELTAQISLNRKLLRKLEKEMEGEECKQ